VAAIPVIITAARPVAVVGKYSSMRSSSCSAFAIWAFSIDLIAPDPGWRQKSITGRRNPHRRVLTAKQPEPSADGSKARSSNKFAADSPLEQSGFEPPVPCVAEERMPEDSWGLLWCGRLPIPHRLGWDLEFESPLLQGGVTNEPSVCWVDLEPRADPARARSEGRR
jgi:hypothetical protein